MTELESDQAPRGRQLGGLVLIACLAVLILASITPSAADARRVSERLATQSGCPRTMPSVMQGFRLDMLADISDAGRCGVVWSAVSLLRNTEPAVREHLERGDTAAIVVMWIHEATVRISSDDDDASSSYFDPPYGARLSVAAWVALIRWRGPNAGLAEVWVDKGTGVARQRRTGRRSSAPD